MTGPVPDGDDDIIDYMTHWIQNTVLYQIYPRSFYDSDRNGIGDLGGITAKLDYLKDLGVGAVWISPFYPSPMADFGYDIKDYQDVDPIFGTLSDFDTLLSEAHARDIKIIVDFVPNHTSDEHPWFKESRQSIDNPKRDWYVWQKPGTDGKVPNNWLSLFGGSAWEIDPQTNEYYLHSFLKKQPDLNWDNPEVRATMAANVRFWFDRGVDGIRVDAVNWLSKDSELKDDPLNSRYIEYETADPYHRLTHANSSMGPHLFEYLRVLEDVVKSYDERFMIVESYPDNDKGHEHYVSFYEKLDPQYVAPFNFDAISLPWSAEAFHDSVGDFLTQLSSGYIPIYSLGNHDQHRLATRFNPDATRCAAMLLLTLPGAPIIYYGDEIGMTDGVIEPDQVHDPFELNNPGHGLGRDPERTPMQWNNQLHAGFTTATPWLPVSENYNAVNVAVSHEDPSSILSLYRTLIALRREEPAFSTGSFEVIDVGSTDVFAYERDGETGTYLVLHNFSAHPAVVSRSGTIVLSTIFGRALFNGVLEPHESIILTSDT